MLLRAEAWHPSTPTKRAKAVLSFCVSKEDQKDLWGVFSGPAGSWARPIKPNDRFCARSRGHTSNSGYFILYAPTQHGLTSKPCHPVFYKPIFHIRIRVFCQTQLSLSGDQAGPTQVSDSLTGEALHPSLLASKQCHPRLKNIELRQKASKNFQKHRIRSKASDKPSKNMQENRRESKLCDKRKPLKRAEVGIAGDG